MLIKYKIREPLASGLLADDFFKSFFPSLQNLNSVFGALDEPMEFRGLSGDSLPKMNIYVKRDSSHVEADKKDDPEDYKLKYVIEAAIAGLNKEDVNISLKGNTLSINYDPEKSTEERVYQLHELSHRSFRRNVLIPEMINLESLKTEFVNGVVKLEFDIFEEDPKAKKINF